MAQPMCRSISTIFSTEDVSRRVDVTRFSTPRITPSEVETYSSVRRERGDRCLREKSVRLLLLSRA
jgi:hypothetical protein